MLQKGLSQPTDTLRYAVVVGSPERAAIDETLVEYGRMFEIMEQVADCERVGSDVVRLQRLAYERIRADTKLPAQFVLLGIRDFAARRSSPEPTAAHPLEDRGLPLDEKLYAIKGPS